MQHKYVVNYACLLTHFASSFVVQKVMRLCQNVDYHLLEVYRYHAFAHVGRLLRGAAVDFEVFVRPTEAIHCTDACEIWHVWV